MEITVKELAEKLDKGFADLGTSLSAKVDSQIKSIREELKLPVTRNADAIAALEGARVTPAIEATDPLKGKGLMFARTCRLLCEADRQRVDPVTLGKSWGMPDGIVARLMDRDGRIEKALGESSMAGGGVLTPDQYSQEFIELLRANVVLLNAGVTRIPMSSKSISLGRQNGAASATWIGESQNMNKSEQTFDEVQLVLKKLACLTPISNDLLRDNAIAADIIVRNDLLAVAARELDLKAMRGLGTAYSPRGLLSLIATSNKFNSYAAGTPTLATAQKDLNKVIRLVKEGNVPFTKQTAGFLMSPRVEDGYRRLTDGVGRPFYAEEMDRGTLLGYPFYTTTAIPNNLTGNGSGGSNESEVYFVVFPQVFLGEGLAPTIEVARNAAYYDGSAVQSGLSRDETAVSIILRADTNMRHTVGAALIQGVVEGV
jgi:HK97 family phage major capsid protein